MAKPHSPEVGFGAPGRALIICPFGIDDAKRAVGRQRLDERPAGHVVRQQPGSLYRAANNWERCGVRWSTREGPAFARTTPKENAMRNQRNSAATWCRELGRRLFAARDAQAHANGWQVTPIRGGLGRRYRDPRFDSLARCPDCAGTGGPAEAPCQPCSGSGRVVLQPSFEGRRAR
jgi:hypothetical protein